ncbi:hypothetical protein BH11ARM2_BH11ARM2_22780 [soil metagenome]
MTPVFHDLQTPAAYEAAMAEMGRLWGAPEGSEEAENRDLLAAAIARYEEIAYPSGPVTPLDVVRFHLEARGREGRKELDSLLGGSSRTSEILKGKRRLSQKMIVALHRAWSIPYELLLEDSNALPESAPPSMQEGVREAVDAAVRQTLAETLPAAVDSAVRSAFSALR